MWRALTVVSSCKQDNNNHTTHSTIQIAHKTQKVVGTAVGLNLLFKLPLLPAILLTSLDGLLLLLLVPRRAVRSSELLTVGLLAVVVGCFVIDLVASRPRLSQVSAFGLGGGDGGVRCGRAGKLQQKRERHSLVSPRSTTTTMHTPTEIRHSTFAHKHTAARIVAPPPPAQVVAGLVPRLPRDSVATAVSIVGANVMPHSFFLHSALVSGQARGQPPSALRALLAYNALDVAAALGVALLINLAILLVSAATFHEAGESAGR